MDTKKVKELIASNEKLAELLHMKKEEEAKKKNVLVYVLAIIGAVAAVAAIAYAVYRHMNPAYLEDTTEANFEEEMAEDVAEEAVEEETVAEGPTEEDFAE